MRRGVLVLLCSFLLMAGASWVRAETVVEAWRGGGFVSPYSVSVNPTDGSCWVADTNNNQVVHLSPAARRWREGGVR